MSTPTESQNSQAPTIVISNTNSEGEENGIPVATEENELVEEPSNSGHEESASVEITRLETERDIALAALGHDAQIQQIEANKEIAEKALEKETNIELELEECRNQISALKSQITELENLLTPQVSQEQPIVTEPLETVTEPNLIQPSTQEDIIETAVGDVNEDAETVVEKPIRKIVGI